MQAQFKTNFITASPETSWKGSTGVNEYTNPAVEKPEYSSGCVNYSNPNLPNNIGGFTQEQSGDINYGSYTVHTSPTKPAAPAVNYQGMSNNQVAFNYGTPVAQPVPPPPPAAAAAATAAALSSFMPPPPPMSHPTSTGGSPPAVSPPSGGSSDRPRKKKSRWDL